MSQDQLAQSGQRLSRAAVIHHEHRKPIVAEVGEERRQLPVVAVVRNDDAVAIGHLSSSFPCVVT